MERGNPIYLQLNSGLPPPLNLSPPQHYMLTKIAGAHELAQTGAGRTRLLSQLKVRRPPASSATSAAHFESTAATP